MSRFVEECRIYRAGEPRPAPATVGGLLNRLRLATASDDVKRQAIIDWLDQNEPSPLLLELLRRAIVDWLGDDEPDALLLDLMRRVGMHAPV